MCSLAKRMSDGAFKKFYQSNWGDYVKYSYTVEKTIQEFCNGDFNREILLEFYDFRKNGDHKFIGSAVFTVNRMLNGDTQELKLINPQEDSHKSHGKIRIEDFIRMKKPSFNEYISSGLEIKLNIAIDFTSSNGDPKNPSSLHYADPSGHNLYESALLGVSEILLNYSSDKLFSIYGFGGGVDGEVNHCLPLTFDAENANVQGLDGIINTYRTASSQIILSSPRHFAPIISKIVNDSKNIKQSQTSQRCHILLTLTNGDPDDMQETISSIIEASWNGVSIIIIGIGSGNFENLAYLGSDYREILKKTNGAHEKSDCVKFIDYREVDHFPVALRNEVFNKIPEVVTEFLVRHNCLPNYPGDYFSAY